MIFPMASRNYIFSPRDAFPGAGASPATQTSLQMVFAQDFKSSHGSQIPLLVAKRRRLGSAGKFHLLRLVICYQGGPTHPQMSALHPETTFFLLGALHD